MNKKAIAMMTGLLLSGTMTAFAAPDDGGVTVNGSLSVHYRDQYDKADGSADTKTGWKTTVTLNVDAPLSKNLSAYANANYQSISSQEGAGWIADYSTSTKSKMALSAFGLKYSDGADSYVVGKQFMTLGGGLVYDNGYFGQHNVPYAANITKKIGATTLNVIAAQTAYQSGLENDKFYTVQGSWDVGSDANMGLMYTHVSYGKDTVTKYGLPDKNVNFYSIYGTKNLSDLFSLSAEYLKGSTQNDNTAYQTNLNYKVDDKNTLSVGYYHAEDQSDIVDYNTGDLTTAWNTNTRGYSFAWKHKFDKNTNWKVGYFTYDRINPTSQIAGGTDRHRFYTTATVSF